MTIHQTMREMTKTKMREIRIRVPTVIVEVTIFLNEELRLPLSLVEDAEVVEVTLLQNLAMEMFRVSS